MRLNTDRQQELEPKRKEFAKAAIIKAGYEIIYEDDKKIQFIFNDKKVTLYPYSGWYTGKSVHDGRGLMELLSQIKKS